MGDKIKFPYELAFEWAKWLKTYLEPCCNKIEIAGSLRREQAEVGDIEILYIPKMEKARKQFDFFSDELEPVIDRAIKQLESEKILTRRLNKNGAQTYGPKNKLMKLTGPGIPVDLFAANEKNWFNYLVCRTGPTSCNVKIAILAKRRGYSWKPYGEGFSKGIAVPETVPMRSEQEVFEFVDMEYKKPNERR